MSGWMYLGLVLVLIISLVILLVGLPQYRTRQSKSERKWFTLHPVLSMISILLSVSITLFSLIAILFVFPRSFVFWNNHLLLHTRYYTGAEWLYVMIGVLTTGWVAMLLWTRRLFNSSTPGKKKKRMLTILLLLFPLLILIFIVIIGVLNQLFTSKGMISLIPFGIFSIVIASTLGRYTFKILDITFPWLRRKINVISNDSKNKRRSLILSGVIVFSVVSIFMTPLVVQPPNIDALGVTVLQNFNNTNVPFQNEIIYPSFDTQRTTDEQGSRKFFKVGGNWQFTFQEEGLWSGDDLSLLPRTAHVIEQMATGWEANDYIPSGWDTILVPSSFNRPDHPTEAYQDAQGICLYRRWFSLTDLGISITHLEANNISVILKFLGANYITDVWLDGRYIGYHEGGFTSFAFDVTEILKEEHDTSHLLAVRVDTGGYNLPNFAKLAPGFADWFNYGGVYREVYFEVVPRAHVIRADMQITTLTPASTPPRNGSVDLQIDVAANIRDSADFTLLNTPTLAIGFYPIEYPNQTSKFESQFWNYINYSASAQPTVTNGELNRTISVSGWQGTDNSIYRFSISLDNVKFWTEKQPALYALEANLSLPGMHEIFFDRYISQVGFREISLDTHEFQLNGAPMFLAGNALHEEFVGSGRTLSSDRIWNDLLLMQGIHSNLIRSHYTLHPDYYLFGDRLGITFWEELSVYWFSDVSFLEIMVRGLAESLFLEMVYRDYNRPSIFFWSVANEPWSEGLLLDYLSEFRTLQELIDPSRILGFAATPTQTHIQAFQDLEMITVNLYAHSEDKFNEITTLTNKLVSQYPNKPILITEYGKPLDSYIPAFLENPNMAGICHWVGFDYYSNYHLDFNYYWSGSGVYNRDRASYRDYLPYMNATYANLTLYNP